MDEVKIEREGDDEDKRRNIKVGCGVVAVALLTIPALVIGIPLVVALYKWAFGW